MVRVQRWVRPAAAMLVGACAVLATPMPALAAYQCPTKTKATSAITEVPYEDKVYTPEKLAPLATGRGIRVAVIDSGVDGSYPQLVGRVEQGADFLHGNRNGLQDCAGHGTGVASIIAARPSPDNSLRGLAPDATIVPIRISESNVYGKERQDGEGTPAQFAAAIRWAVDKGRVNVINLSLVMGADIPVVREAVYYALGHNVVVVAAAGNDAAKGNPRPWPASYKGVIGVGALSPNGRRAGFSQTGDYVSIAAFGDSVTMAYAGGGQTTGTGTSFATPLVSATAALILQRFPGSTPAEVARRIEATADPSPGGPGSPEYGAGLLDPYRALTETPVLSVPSAAPATVPAIDPVAVALARRRAGARDHSLAFAGAGIGLALLLAAGTIVVRQGRRRGWRPATAGMDDQ